MQTTTGVSHSTRPPQRRSGDELPIKEAIAWSGDSGVGPHRIATADGHGDFYCTTMIEQCVGLVMHPTACRRFVMNVIAHHSF